MILKKKYFFILLMLIINININIQAKTGAKTIKQIFHNIQKNLFYIGTVSICGSIIFYVITRKVTKEEKDTRIYSKEIFDTEEKVNKEIQKQKKQNDKEFTKNKFL